MLQLYQGKIPHPHIRRNLCSYVAMLHVYTYIYTFVGKNYIYILVEHTYITYYLYEGGVFLDVTSGTIGTSLIYLHFSCTKCYKEYQNGKGREDQTSKTHQNH